MEIIAKRGFDYYSGVFDTYCSINGLKHDEMSYGFSLTQFELQNGSNEFTNYLYEYNEDFKKYNVEFCDCSQKQFSESLEEYFFWFMPKDMEYTYFPGVMRWTIESLVEGMLLDLEVARLIHVTPNRIEGKGSGYEFGCHYDFYLLVSKSNIYIIHLQGSD